MIGDHHGWAAGTATLLLTALDRILGTHRAAAILARLVNPGQDLVAAVSHSSRLPGTAAWCAQ
jgi:hypothetical protein